MKVTHVYKTDYMRLFKQGFILACILALLIFKANATSVIVTPKEVWIYKQISYSSKLQLKCEM